LDRDGTLIVEKSYLSDPDEVELEIRAVQGLQRLAETGLPLIVVSNQSGVGRGRFSAEKVDAVNRRLSSLLSKKGVVIAGWYFCPHAPEAGCECRKPRTGMAIAAASTFGLDLTRCFVIGDKRADVELARNLGGSGILVTTGYGNEHRSWALENGVPVCRDMEEAAEIVVGRLSARA